jgi:hypothetical protein
VDITLDVTLTLELAAARQPLDFDLDLAVHGLDLYRALARAHTAARALARPGSSHFAAGFASTSSAPSTSPMASPGSLGRADALARAGTLDFPRARAHARALEGVFPPTGGC